MRKYKNILLGCVAISILLNGRNLMEWATWQQNWPALIFAAIGYFAAVGAIGSIIGRWAGYQDMRDNNDFHENRISLHIERKLGGYPEVGGDTTNTDR